MPALPLIAVLNGPNMALLGRRQPGLYGTATLDDVDVLCARTAAPLGFAVESRQTDDEGELVSFVQDCRGRAAAIVINPAGCTPTSVALLDALAATGLPTIEVHVTAMQRRETFRHRSMVSGVADGVIAGLGVQGYALAIQAAARLTSREALS